jgi:hypothetical protein
LTNKRLAVTFILTCHDREEYVPYALRVIESYRSIKPQVILCYNGEQDLACDVRLPPLKKHHGDHSLTMAGYRLRRHQRIVKLSIDSWLLDESVIVNIFRRLESEQKPYAGNYWHSNWQGSLSTDVIFADLRFGNIFKGWNDARPSMEDSMWRQLTRLGKKPLLIEERHPIHFANRFACAKLRWTMEHDLQRNLANARAWAPSLGF